MRKIRNIIQMMTWPKIFTLVLCTSLLNPFNVRAFTPPSEKERIKAIGKIDHLPKSKRCFFLPGNQFAPIKKPGGSDWLACHKEDHQTYDTFLSEKWNVPDQKRRIIYLRPIGSFKEKDLLLINDIAKLSTIYFGLETKALPAITLKKGLIRSRTNSMTRNKQLYTGDLLRVLKQRLPSQAYTYLGVSEHGLYPDPDWNFVYGMASLSERVGVYSFYRFGSELYGKKSSPGTDKLKRLRAIKLMIHETGHTFGLGHCTFYECIMKGVNHMKESDNNPIHLCPVCLRKLYSSVKFNMAIRYEKLQALYLQLDLKNEAEWIEKRRNFVNKN